jgi:hypothetical protein
LGKSSLHQHVLSLLKFLSGDACLVGNGLLSINNQYFSVGQVLHQAIDVLFRFEAEGSLLLPGLLGQSFVLRFDKFESRLDDLGVSLDVKSIDCSWKILDLN